MSKNIWIWNHYASDMFRNKGGRHYWFAQNLISRGYKVTIFCSNTFHNSADVIDLGKNNYTSIVKDSIEFIFIKTRPFEGNGKDRILNMIAFYRNVKKVAKTKIQESGNPDILLASSVHPLTLLAGVQIGKKYNIPCISEMRDLWPEAIFKFGYLKENSLFGRILKRGEKYIYEHSDALIFVKPGDVEYLIENKWDKKNGGNIDLKSTFYINNGVDLKDFKNNAINNQYPDVDLDSDAFKVIYTGTINPVNNIDLIVNTSKFLDDNIKVLIFGSGNQLERLLEIIEKDNIKNIVFKGRIEKKYIPYVLSKSDLNLLNYSQEQYNWKRGNSSNKLFEYLASATPVLSTVKMGYSLINEYSCGTELDGPSSKELAKSINDYKLMSSEKYEAQSNNAYKVAQLYDFEYLTTKLEEVFEHVLNEG